MNTKIPSQCRSSTSPLSENRQQDQVPSRNPRKCNEAAPVNRCQVNARRCKKVDAWIKLTYYKVAQHTTQGNKAAESKCRGSRGSRASKAVVAVIAVRWSLSLSLSHRTHRSRRRRRTNERTNERTNDATTTTKELKSKSKSNVDRKKES